MSKKTAANQDTPLVSESAFEKAVKKVLRVSKKESDKQMAAFQASNRKRREKRQPKS